MKSTCDLCEDFNDTATVSVELGKGSGFGFTVCRPCLYRMVPPKLRPENAWKR